MLSCTRCWRLSCACIDTCIDTNTYVMYASHPRKDLPMHNETPLEDYGNLRAVEELLRSALELLTPIDTDLSRKLNDLYLDIVVVREYTHKNAKRQSPTQRP